MRFSRVNDRMKKDYAVSIAKGIGIIGVVAHHLANRRFPEVERSWIALPGQLCLWAVPLFIVVSGYLHAGSHARHPTPPGVFLLARVRRLLIPYAIISLVYAIVYSLLIRAGLLNDALGEPAAWYKLWWGSLTLNGGVGEQLYFLPLLFVVSMAALLPLTLVRYTPGPLLFMAAILVAAPFLRPDLLAQIPGHMVWPWDRFVAGVGLYLVGFLLQVQPTWRLRLFSVTVVLVAAAAFAGRTTAAHFLFSVVIFAGLLLSKPRARPLELTGDASGTIFLYHTPFFLQPLLVLIATKTPASWHVLLAMVALLGTVAFFTIAHHILLRTRLRRLAF
ncbi:MAG: acyltransferase [Nibricoccus sp.]